MTYTSKKYLFIDPTIIISARALQAQYPDISFAKISPRLSSVYEILHNLDLKRERSLKKILANAIFLSRKDFVDNYLQKINMERIDYSNLTVFVPEEIELISLENIYRIYFERT